MKKAYVFNQNWTCLKGKEFWDEERGELDFGCEAPLKASGLRADGTYRTRYGGFEHSGRIYENSNHNVKIALRRIFRAAGGSVEAAAQLRVDQSTYISKNLDFLEHLRKLYEPVMSKFRGFLVEAEDHYDDPHAKKALREQAWKELFETGTVTNGIWLEYTIYKMKKNEFGKVNSEPRMIGDLQVPASLEGFMVTKYLKQAMQNNIDLPYGTMHFCATPAHVDLTSVFENLMNPMKRFYMAYFSDDSCISVRQPDGSTLIYNMDISSCDASHTSMLFWALTRIVDGMSRENFIRLIDQLRTLIRVYDVSRPNRGPDKRYAEFKKSDGSPTLYSGSTITTVINNLANILIGHSILTAGATTPDEIIKAAANVGYIITLEPCPRPEDIQFLKHSPVLDTTGVYRPVLNLGVMFRSMGTAKGDVPGKQDVPLKERFRAFEHALLHGMYPRSHFPFVDRRKRALRGADGSQSYEQSQTLVERELAYKVIGTEEHSFHAEDIYRRYNLTTDEISLLDETIANQPFTTFHACSAASKVLETDYGLSCPGTYPTTASA